MKIYVGNLSFEVTEDELAAEFGAYGQVDSVSIPADRISGRPRGFAFVEMGSKSEAEAAITGLNGKVIKERTIVVNESRPAPTGVAVVVTAAAGAAAMVAAMVVAAVTVAAAARAAAQAAAAGSGDISQPGGLNQYRQ